MRPVPVALALLVLAAGLAGCLNVPEPPAVDVLATHYPLAFLASFIARGTNVTVGTMVAGADPHDWEPSVRDALRLQEAKLYLAQGAGLDWWLPNLVRGLGPEAPPVVDTTANVSLIVHPPGTREAGTDPHTWVAPATFLQQAHAVEAAMVRAFPRHADAFHANARVLDHDLQTLDRAYRTNLTSCSTRTVLVNHDALGYLARELNLTVLSIQGLSPEAEPSPVALATLAQTAGAQHLHVVLVDGVANPQAAELLAQAVGGRTLLFTPVPSLTPRERVQGDTYLTLQYRNLANLQEALGCR